MIKFWFNLFKAIILKITLIVVLHTTAGAMVESIEKAQTPPGQSGSYLQYNEGFLTHKKTQNNLDYLKKEKRGITTAKRFDQSVNSEIGNQKSVVDFLNVYAYDQNADSWEGFCDVWSAAAHEHTIKKLLRDTEGLICHGTILSKGDLTELFTAFFDAETKYFYPDNIELTPHDKRISFIQAARDQVGMTYFEPHLFHEKIHHYMNQGQRVTLNVDSGPEIWNQPVISVDSKVQKYTASDFAIMNEKMLEKFNLPPLAIKAKNHQGKKVIAELEAISDAFLELSNLAQETDDAYPSISHFTRNLSASLKKELGDVAHLTEFSQKLAQLKSQKLKWLIDRPGKPALIEIMDGYDIKLVDTKVDYLKEGQYKDTTIWTESAQYNYMVISRGKKDIASLWQTPLEERPGFIAVPKCTVESCIKLANKNDNWFSKEVMPKKVLGDYSISKRKWKKAAKKWDKYEKTAKAVALRNLIDLFKKCVDYKEVQSFNVFLKRAVMTFNNEPIDKETELSIVDWYHKLTKAKVPLNRSEILKQTQKIKGFKALPK